MRFGLFTAVVGLSAMALGATANPIEAREASLQAREADLVAREAQLTELEERDVTLNCTVKCTGWNLCRIFALFSKAACGPGT